MRHPRRLVDGIGHGGEGRDKRGFTYTAEAKRMARVWHLEDDRLDHRHVKTSGHAIV